MVFFQFLISFDKTELCRSDVSSRALFSFYNIRSGSELKERRLISDSKHPGGFAAFAATDNELRNHTDTLLPFQQLSI